MVLVDTSVMIDYMRGRRNQKTELFEELLRRDIPFGMSAYSYQELLQGAGNEDEFNMLDAYLSTQQIYILPSAVDTYRKAAGIFFYLRRKGVTIRSTIDVLIALTAIENGLPLLHNDRDFDNMARELKALNILRQL